MLGDDSSNEDVASGASEAGLNDGAIETGVEAVHEGVVHAEA